jgi:hypothetical protein
LHFAEKLDAFGASAQRLEFRTGGSKYSTDPLDLPRDLAGGRPRGRTLFFIPESIDIEDRWEII